MYKRIKTREKIKDIKCPKCKNIAKWRIKGPHKVQKETDIFISETWRCLNKDCDHRWFTETPIDEWFRFHQKVSNRFNL